MAVKVHTAWLCRQGTAHLLLAPSPVNLDAWCGCGGRLEPVQAVGRGESLRVWVLSHSEDGVTVVLTIKVHPLEALTAGHPRTTR